MSAHTDFIEQLTLEGGGRPDMVVRLPGGRQIAVDAKAPLSGYLDAAEATDKRNREEALDRHVKNIRNHIRGLASREYAERLGSDFDLVVLFLPGDAYLGAAFAKDPELQIEAMRSKILIATPTTLIALLRTVAIYWQQQSMAQNAEEIAAVAKELYDRAANFSTQLGKVGKGLRSAVDAYNSAVGSFDRRLVPMKRRLEDLKVSEQSNKSLESPGEIEIAPRRILERSEK